MNIWKIETWEVPSTNRTNPPISIAGFRITFSDGVIGVDDNNNNSLVLLISYFDNEGRERAFLKDNISAQIIRQKGVEMGMEDIQLETFVNTTMNMIVVHAIGGETKEERYNTISTLAQMYGQTLLPLEEQTGVISKQGYEISNI